MSTLTISASGKPQPQGSKIPGITKAGKPYVREQGGDGWRAWRDTVSTAARLAMYEYGVEHGAPWAMLDEACYVDVTFCFETRSSRDDAEGALKVTSPDIDKLVRSVLDSLTDAGVWKDDSRVAHLTAQKQYTTRPENVGAYIEVSSREG